MRYFLTAMARSLRPMLVAAALLGVIAIGQAGAQSETHEMEGQASWYGGKFQGRLTANGEVFDTSTLTAAHKTLPFNTVVEVTRMDNGLTVQVRINDRGPFVEGRVIDLSRAAAEALQMTGEGIAAVSLRVVSDPAPETRTIQVGSFTDRSNADAVGQRLVTSGVAASIETVVSPSGSAVFRVVIPGVPETDVVTMLGNLESIGFGSVLVRSR